ncbi:MAG: hypothetical protein Q9218_003852 [Villophora microphyllina]
MGRKKYGPGARNTAIERATRHYPSHVPSLPNFTQQLPFRPKLTFMEKKSMIKTLLPGSRPSMSEAAKGRQPEMEAPEEPSKWGPLPANYEEYIYNKQPELKKYKIVYNQMPNSYALLLRFPNRRPDQPYNEANGQKPLEIRIKPEHGHVEVDIPINIKQHWNHDKAVDYQHAMRNSTVLQNGGSYSLAGGLGNAGKPAPAEKSTDRPKPAGPSKETLLANIDDANEKGHVMNKITLGGRLYPAEEGDPTYMIGTFKGDILYMSRLDGIVDLTANFVHLDALADLNKSAPRHKRNSENEEAEAEPEPELEAKAVNLTVTSADPDEDKMPGGKSEIAQYLQDMADEPWQRMKWHDHDSPESWQHFNEHFGIDKGIDDLPELVATMTAREWYDKISAPRYDYTTQSYRKMTFPKKGVPDQFFDFRAIDAAKRKAEGERLKKERLTPFHTDGEYEYFRGVIPPEEHEEGYEYEYTELSEEEYDEDESDEDDSDDGDSDEDDSDEEDGSEEEEDNDEDEYESDWESDWETDGEGEAGPSEHEEAGRSEYEKAGPSEHKH